MYNTFECPVCRKKNIAEEAIPTSPPTRIRYDGGCLWQTCSLKSTLWWVESESAKREVTARFGDAAVAVGGSVAKPGDAPPGIAIGGYADVADLVQTRYRAVLLQNYSQGERIKEHTPAANGQNADIKDGVCEGQCLHWLRRVLQGGRETYSVAPMAAGLPRTPEQTSEKEKSQHLGGVVAQRTAIDVRNADYQAFVSRFNQKYAGKGISIDGTKLKFEAHVPESMRQQAREETGGLDRGFYNRTWGSASKQYDQSSAKAGVDKKRLYSGIVCTGSVQQKFDGVEAFAKALLSSGRFVVGAGALIRVDLRVGYGEGGGMIAGHAIAVHYLSPSELLLFDPNIGIFQCASLGGLNSSLQALMEEGWTKVLGWQLTGNYGYALFDARDPQAAITARESRIVYAASPAATFYENKACLPGETGGTGAGFIAAAPYRRRNAMVHHASRQRSDARGAQGFDQAKK